MRIVAIPVQFRTVAAALAARAGRRDHRRRRAARDDPARAPVLRRLHLPLRSAPRACCATLTEAEYFARDHVIVSYNGDLRGIVEDMFGKNRKVRCSVSELREHRRARRRHGDARDHPELVAAKILATRPHLKTKPLPPTLPIEGSHAELFWPAVTDDDEPCKFLRAKIRQIARRSRGRSDRPSADEHRAGGRPGHERELTGAVEWGWGLQAAGVALFGG